MNVIKDLKRQVIKSIKAKVTPHMWNSGYLDDTQEKKYMRIFSFADVHGSGNRSMGRVFNGELTCLQGFYEHGTIDACGGGCACVPFEGYCLEDLLAIEKWLDKNMDKEVPRAQVAKAEHAEHSRYMVLWHKGKAKLAWPEHLAAWRNKQKLTRAM
jgi:hypothetical protein